MIASPLPPVKVCSEARELVSCTGTLRSSASRYARPAALSAPLWDRAPYPAIRFHRAPPDANGFGVITCTPGLTRSSQVLMPFGLPLRVAITTTESVMMPLVASAFQSAGTRFALTRRVMSGSRGNATISALSPAAPPPLLSPEAPDDLGHLTLFPPGVALD